MPPSSAQKAAITEFVGITHCDKTAASKLLKQHNYNVSAAVNAFYGNSGAASSSSPSQASLSKIFDKYRDDPKNAPDEIGPEGTGNLLSDINIDLTDVGALVFSELVQSPSLGSITREGFLAGCGEHGVDGLPKLKNIVLARRAQLPSDHELFKSVYTHTFALALQERQKALSPEMAMEFWKVLFNAPAYQWQTPSAPWLDWWLEFYEAKVNKAVNKDLWKQTLNFANETMKDESLSFWTEESSWPSVIDEFVDWVKTEKRESNDGDAMNVDG